MTHESIRVVKFAGVLGDRWYRPRWMYLLRWLNAKRKGKPVGVTAISILSLADLEMANREMPEPFTPLDLRRNVVVSGPVNLNALLGVQFSIGTVMLRGDNLCTPCGLPPKRANKGDVVQFLKAFGHPKFSGTNRGGLRAQILIGGTIKKGDVLIWK